MNCPTISSLGFASYFQQGGEGCFLECVLPRLFTVFTNYINPSNQSDTVYRLVHREVVSSRLRLGHTYFTHVFFVEDPPICQCINTVQHYFECNSFNQLRKKYISGIICHNRINLNIFHITQLYLIYIDCAGLYYKI